MSATTRKIIKANTKPTDVDALASQLVDQLRSYIVAATPQLKMYIASVVDVAVGPPPTITVSIHGYDIGNIRFIGSVPSEGDLVVVLAGDSSQYVALGVLASA